MMHAKNTTRRNPPLAQHHQQTARLLFLTFDAQRSSMKGSVPSADLKVVRWNLTRLINLSGTRREGDNHAQAFTRALQGLRVMIDAGWIDHNKVYTHAEAIADRLEPYAPESEKFAEKKPAQTFTSRVGERVNLPKFDLFPGDEMSVEETRDIRPGELVWCKFDNDRAGVARLVKLDSEAFTVRTHEEEEQTHLFADIKRLGRVTGYTRTVTFSRPDVAEEGEPQESPASVVRLADWKQKTRRA